MGRITDWIAGVFSRTGGLPPPEDFGCCALDDAAGSGHRGPCAWKCGTCHGSGMCPACDGWAGELAGCRGCDGSGACPEGCDEGWRYDE